MHRQAADLDRRIAQRTQHLCEANEELRRSEERFAKAFHGIPAGLAILAMDGGCFIDVNAAFAEMTDVPRDEIIGRTPAEAGVPLDFPPAILEAVRAGRTGQRVETRIGEHRAIVSCERIAFGGEPHLLLLAQEISARPQPVIGARTILVAEDDAAIRSHVKELLVHHEYRVLEAANAGAAMEIWRDQRESIDLLLTDMVMPGTDNGLDLARQFLNESPGLKVIYTSGYGLERFANEVELEEGRNYLSKPYLSYQLIDVLRSALPPSQKAGA